MTSSDKITRLARRPPPVPTDRGGRDVTGISDLQRSPCASYASPALDTTSLPHSKPPGYSTCSAVRRVPSPRYNRSALRHSRLGTWLLRNKISSPIAVGASAAPGNANLPIGASKDAACARRSSQAWPRALPSFPIGTRRRLNLRKAPFVCSMTRLPETANSLGPIASNPVPTIPPVRHS
jgi:hypothetical protein